MSEDSKLHVIVGSSGATGSAVARELLRRGQQVRGVNRSGRAPSAQAIEVVKADATDKHSMRDAVRGATVVYNCVNPPFESWREMFPPIIDALIDGAAATGAKLVFADDTWMYGKVTGPMTEDLPYRPVSHRGVLRALLAEMVLGAHARGKVIATIGRASELYGPAVRSVLADNLFGAATRGRRVSWIGDPDMPLTPTYIDDFGRVLVTLGERAESAGEVWHVPHPEPITGRDFVMTVFDEIGQPMKLRVVRSAAVKALGVVWPLARLGSEMVYQFEQPFIVDGGKYSRAFGDVEPTPYRDGIGRTIGWYRKQ